MSGGDDLFKVETAWDETTKRRERAMVAQCSKCPRRSMVADNAGKARPMVYFAGRFRAKGWRIGGRANAHLCPNCVGTKPAVDLTPAQRRAAFCRIAAVPRAATSPEHAPQKPKEADMTKTAKAPALAVVADPPRQPTREDKRKIREALDACYLIDKNCYVGDGNDRALAAKLDVPRAWVAAERDDAYGPDACEDDGKDSAVLAKISADLKRLGDEALDLAGRFEAEHRKVETLRAKLAKRGVA